MAAACSLALSAAAALAQDCGKAVSAVEKTICRDANLTRQDADLNRLYSSLRPQLTPKARGELLTQQRAWLTDRNRECATGEAACLEKKYETRLGEMEALSAAAQVGEDKLNDVTAVVVKGSWKASRVEDPGGAGHTSEADVRESLVNADLPAVGSMVSAVPGKVCVAPQACRMMAWTRKTLAEVDGGKAIARVLGLSLTESVLVGDTGAKESPRLLLAPRSDGSVWAIFGLCGPNSTNCRNAAEDWTPAAPVAVPHS
jgi:uncharacterized protein